MAEKVNLCDICAFQHLNVPAVEWCSECEEALYTQCKVQHSIGKATRNHTPVPVENYQQLPPFLLTLTQSCTEHDGKLEFYCNDHDEICCIRCTRSTHKDCKSVDVLREIVQDVKLSSKFTDLEKSVEDLHENMDEISKESQGLVESLKNQKSKCASKIKEFRQSIDKQLDKLQQVLLDDLENQYHNQKCAASATADTIMKRKAEVSEIREVTSKVKEYASDLQAFRYVQAQEEKIREEEESLKAILGNTRLKNVEFEFVPNEGLNSNFVTSFGKIDVIKEGIPFIPKSQKEKEAQLLTVPREKLEEFKVVAAFNVSFPPASNKVCVRDCIVLHNKDIILTDKNNNCLVIFSEEGFYKKKIKLESEPFGLVCVNAKRIAVSLLNNTVCMVDIEQGSTVEHFRLDKTPNSIQLYDNKLVVNIFEFGYYIVNMEGVIERKIPISSEKMPYFVLKNDKIYCAKWESNKVACYNMLGNLEWEFEHEKLRGPNGITIDEDGNLFVVCFISNNLVLVNSEGTKATELLTKLVTPINVHYDKITKRLIIGSNGRVVAYNVY